MISVARLTRWSSMSTTRITTRVTNIVMGTTVPTIRPVRSPRKNITTARTIPSVS